MVPCAPIDILSFHDLAGLQWTKSNVIDFWLPCLAGVETVETGDPQIVGWLAGDDKANLWLQTLGGVALMLVARVIASPVFMKGKAIDRTAMRAILRSVCTFDQTSGDLNIHDGTVPCIVKEPPVAPLDVRGLRATSDADDSVEDSSVGPIMMDTTLNIDRTVRDADMISRRIVSRLPAYAKEAELRRTEIQNHHAKEITQMARTYDLPYLPHTLDTYRTPPATATIIDEVALHYSQSSFEEKHELHIDQVEMEIERLNILIQVTCNQKLALESDLAFLLGREKERQRAIRTLQELWENQLISFKEVRRMKAAQNGPILSEALKKFSEEEIRLLDMSSQDKPAQRHTVSASQRASLSVAVGHFSSAALPSPAVGIGGTNSHNTPIHKSAGTLSAPNPDDVAMYAAFSGHKASWEPEE